MLEFHATLVLIGAPYLKDIIIINLLISIQEEEEENSNLVKNKNIKMHDANDSKFTVKDIGCI